ncbi:MAG: hypothetical protein IJ514_03425 [Clostridia bacterium]|nr:hypothetical protein [Clostridia bacterium]
MNTQYLDLMEKTLSAYTDEHIIRYFNDVKKDGLKEHGFPRLTANIGILIANGRRRDLLPLFCEMMELCCKTIPNVKAANDFSVREIICCLIEIEKNDIVDEKDVTRWKGYLSTIEPKTCYNRFAEKPTDAVRNWALFTGVSEYFRQSIGLCDSAEFIDIQIAAQLQWIDENGMYMDNDEEEMRQPIMYDIVARGLFSLLLYAGYRGKYYTAIDGLLKKSGLMTLKMQSTTGEMAFGGRSNQFLHNEAWLAMILEYEATRYQKEGDYTLAGKFKAGALRALQLAKLWLAKNPITHVKNRFSIDSKYGCETYAYFDKYMITAASFFYSASLFCDDTIQPIEEHEDPIIWSTSKYFHKTFVKTDEYSLEFDTNADPHYDASGLGRIHKKGAPSVLCLSMPFTKAPYYYCGNWINSTEITIPPAGRQVNASQFSICPAIKNEKGEWVYGADSRTQYTLIENQIKDGGAGVVFQCILVNGAEVKFSCFVGENGVILHADSATDKEIGITLPAFDFDGEKKTHSSYTKNKIEVEYENWVCEYSSQNITDLETYFANRNGIYKGYVATGKSSVELKIKIYPLNK